MKKIIYLVAAGVIALCTACSSENEPVIEPKPDPVKPDKPTTDDEPVEASYLHLSQPEKSVVDGLTAFSDKLIDMSAEYTDKEEFNVSPLSVSMYLDLLANSCQGDTRSGILAALGLSDIDALNGVCKRLLDYLPSDGTGAKMHIANHIWVSQRYTVPATFKSRMEDYRMVKVVRRHHDPNMVILHSVNPNYDDMDVPRSKILALYLVETILNYDVVSR